MMRTQKRQSMRDAQRQPAFNAILLVGDALVGQCVDAGTTGLAVEFRSATPVVRRAPAEAPGDNDKQTSATNSPSTKSTVSLASQLATNQMASNRKYAALPDLVIALFLFHPHHDCSSD